MTISRQLVVFDFDWSLADQDTDRWIFEVNAPDLRRKMKDKKFEVQWTDLVAICLKEFHARGGKKEQIEHALQTMPFHPAMIRAVTKLKETAQPQTTFFCLSNANSVFINTILESKGLTKLFEEVVTNPAQWKPDGLLDLQRRIPRESPHQHACKIGCSPNMCKGDELEAFLDRHPPFDRVTYIGDGSNDYCPAVRTRGGKNLVDILLCRRYRGLEQRIKESHSQTHRIEESENLTTPHGEKKDSLPHEIKYWAGAWEVEELFGKHLYK